jgi:hypothetical protein
MILAVGGIAAAEQGGNSADHRKNPTSTTGESTTTTTTTTVAPLVVPKTGDENESSEVESESSREEALQHALCQGSLRGQQMKWEHGAAFHKPGLDLEPCFNENSTPTEGGEEEGTGAQGGPPEHSNAGGNGGGQGGGNPNAANGQGHGKP